MDTVTQFSIKSLWPVLIIIIAIVVIVACSAIKTGKLFRGGEK